MSKRHQANRRRTYGRRQHEVRERRDRVWQDGALERDRVDDGFAAVEGAVADRRALPFGAIWLGLE
ncbi:MAG TPA: hypothetical protein VER83_07830 [Candidatus Nanopelagicales bacterium]|nr:hypothetical protein [Candidatus Nanopelagicales bacterium]